MSSLGAFLLSRCSFVFVFTYTAPTEIYTLSLHDALPIYVSARLEWLRKAFAQGFHQRVQSLAQYIVESRSEEHTSELQSRGHLVCRLLLEKKKTANRLR